jgi:hypothetical protein
MQAAKAVSAMTTQSSKARIGLSHADAARIFGVSRPRVAALVREGRIDKEPDGSLREESVRACAEILAARKAGTRPPNPAQGANEEANPDANLAADMPDDWEGITHAEALRRKEAALAWLRTLEARKAAGELLERADVDAAVMGAFVRVRARLLAIPASVAPLLVGADLPKMAALLEEAVHDALNELADTRVEDLTGEATG